MTGPRRAPNRHRTAAAAAVAVAATMLALLWPGTAAGQQRAPVPCEVAMVIGCVTTVPSGDGTVALTLQVTDPTGRLGGPGAGGAQSPGRIGEAGDDEATTGAETGADTASGDDTGTAGPAGQAAAGQTGDGAALGGPDQDQRPLQSTVDPWERGGLRSNFGSRSIPLSNYQIGADVTGWLGVPDPLDSFVASQTNWAFTTSAFLVLLATNALDWAFEFPLAEDLVSDAGVLAQSYTVDLFGFGLSTSIYSLALSVTMVVAGFKAVTRGLVVAGGEVALAFAAYVVLIVLTLGSGFGNLGLGVARVSSDLAGGIASFAAGQDRQQACALELQADRDPAPLAGATAVADGSAAGAVSSACSFGFALQRSLVELPYQNLQWGQVLDGVEGKERCAAINLELLTEGPWGNDDEPRDRMRAVPECEENADFNHQATYIRLGIASANTIAAAAVTLLVLIVAAMLLWQQIKLLFLTVTIPHALVFAILPGRARQLAWQWGGAPDRCGDPHRDPGHRSGGLALAVLADRLRAADGAGHLPVALRLDRHGGQRLLRPVPAERDDRQAQPGRRATSGTGSRRAHGTGRRCRRAPRRRRAGGRRRHPLGHADRSATVRHRGWPAGRRLVRFRRPIQCRRRI